MFYRNIPSILFLLLVLNGCDNGSSVNGKAGPSSSKEDEEDTAADEPVPVSGSYLTCDWLDPESIESGATTTIGCAVVDKDGMKFDSKQRSFSLTLHDDDDSRIAMSVSEAAADSQWHQLAELPRSHVKNGYVKMIVKKNSSLEGSYTRKTIEIGTDMATSTSLGNVGDSEAIPLGETDSILLKSITTHANWQGISLMIATSTYTAADFCDAGGTLRNEVSTTTQAIITTASAKIGTNYAKDITLADNVFKLGEGRCFNSFKLSGGSSGKSYAHQNADGKCFVLISGGVAHVVSTAKDANPELTLPNIRQFAERQRCID